MDNDSSGRLLGAEIHGFHTLKDLDIGNIMGEAKMRWLRPNEIYAILRNHHYFSINVKPVNLPQSGTIVLFDRKMLRNFRRDGHNWKKKKDGKTVKEAHEHLKVGNEERIHVYYAHGQDKPSFVRRIYWLLDKTLEHIVLVHYRETQELQGSPATPVISSSNLSEEIDSGGGNAKSADKEGIIEAYDSLGVGNHEQRLHEINTLDWDELVTENPYNLTPPTQDRVSGLDQSNETTENRSIHNQYPFSVGNGYEVSPFGTIAEAIAQSNNMNKKFAHNGCIQALGGQVSSAAQGGKPEAVCSASSLDIVINDGLSTQDSFGRWMNSIMVDSPGSIDNTMLESSVSSDHVSSWSPLMENHEASDSGITFKVTDVSPAWAFSTEETKILISGVFHEKYRHLAKSNLFCVCGDVCMPAEAIQEGVYRCMASPHAPGIVNFFLSFDGHTPISQVLTFEYRAPLSHVPEILLEDNSNWKDFQVQTRLAQLLFSTSKCLNIVSNKISSAALKEAKNFVSKTSSIYTSWSVLMKLIGDNRISLYQAKDILFEHALRNKLIEWLLERIIEGCKTTEHDAQGQGVIHLCAILGYTWAVHLFSWSGLSLDFRDKYGWTALHWAAYSGREKMVAALLSAGAKPYYVTDPTSDNPAGCTAADLASKKGFDGLAAYLSEKSLVEHFKDMGINQNECDSPQSTITKTDKENTENLNEEEVYLKDTLAAYRTAADAAARIQSAFREHSFKLRAKEVEASNPELEARNIVAAMKIQHAYRNYESRKKMAAAVRIQYTFRTWKMRREFLNMRRQAVKIQAAFRGYQVRRQYSKIVWSVGVLEKAILRWRLKRKGLRGRKGDPTKETAVQGLESITEEDFFRTSRKQAEERVEKAVVRVQALFRSKKAQQEYHRMKLAHDEANLIHEGLLNPDVEMGT